MRHTRGSSGFMAIHLCLYLPLIWGGLTTAAHAQITNTWTGLGGDNNWSTIGNWDANGVPSAISASTGLDFTGSATAANNDLGTFEVNILQFDVAADLTLSGNDLNFVANGGNTPMLTQNTGFSIVVNNNVTLTDNLTVNQTGSGQINFTGIISGSGSLTISASNAAYTTILSNASNNYSGGTIVAGGTLQLGVDNAVPVSTQSPNGDMMLTGASADAIFDLNGHNQTLNNLTFGDGASINNMVLKDSSGGVGLLTLTGAIDYQGAPLNNGNGTTPPAYISSNVSLATGQHSIGNSNGNYSNGPFDLVIGGQVSGNGGLDVNDVIFVALAHANNTYTGATNINSGQLFLGAINALSPASAVTIDGAGSLYLYISSNNALASTNPVTVNAGNYNQSIASLSDANTSSGFFGTVYLGGATLTVNNTLVNPTTFSGTIADNDGFNPDPDDVGGSLVKAGAGTFTLAGNNTYTGGTLINAGTLQLGINDALPDIANGSTDNTNLTLTGGVLDNNGFNQTLNNVTNNGGAVLIHGGVSTITIAGAYQQSSASSVTQVDTTLSLTPGQDLTLTGGQLVGTGTINNATGSGVITVTNSGGTVHPGDLLPSVVTGTLTINGNYTQTTGGTLQIDLGGMSQGVTYDLLKVSNAVSLEGALDIKLLNGFQPTVGEQFNILEYGSLTGGFSSIVGLDPGYNYLFSSNGGIGTITVETNAVPEASTLISAALIVSTCCLLLRRLQDRTERTKAAS